MLFLFGCQNQEKEIDGFIIRGDIKNSNNNELLVLKFVDGKTEIDSILIVNNKFEYSGKVEEPYFMQLLIRDDKSTKGILSNSGKLTEFLIENSEIFIEGNSMEYDSVKVSGSKSDAILKEYLAKDKILSSEWNTLKIEYDKSVESNDTINRKKIGKELNNILQVQRIDLLKKYVSDNSNSVIGGLLPTFCTLEDVLTKENYEEIYNMLSEKIKNSQYGKSLFRKFNEVELSLGLN